MLEYHHADRLDFAVIGTPNRLEYDQGFFVKNGDGSADVKPIAHLYKTQVYQLSEHLGVPAVIRERPPTTDTYALEQSQEEFYFSVPFDKLDLCLYALNEGLPAEAAAAATGLDADDRGARLRGHRAQAEGSGIPARSSNFAYKRLAVRGRPRGLVIFHTCGLRQVEPVSTSFSTGLCTRPKMSYGLASSCSPIERRPFR